MSRRDDIENIIGMIDDDIVCEYMDKVGRRRRIRSARVAVSIAVAALLLAIPLAIGILNRDSGTDVPVTDTGSSPVTDDVPVTEPEGKFSVLSVTAAKKDAQGFISGDTSFFIRTENGSVDRVREGLTIEPALEYTVCETEEAECFEIVLRELIPDNTVVRLSHVEDQVVTDSWAFQTREVLSVSGTFPAGGTMNCDVHTTVELEFSYASAENVDEHVTFQPELDGKWEHVGKTWRFTPAVPLERETAYTVTVSPGITAEDEVIDSEYVFTFGTFEEEPALRLEPAYAAADRTVTAAKGESVRLSFILSRLESDGGVSHGVSMSAEDLEGIISSVSFARFNSVKDFTASAAGDILCETAPAGETDYTLTYNEKSGVYELTLDTLPEEGYYLVTVTAEGGTILGSWHLQVNSMSAFLMTSADNLLLWVTRGDELASDVGVTLRKKEYRTDSDGLLQIDLSDVSSLEGEYLYVGDGDTPLAVGISESLRSYPRGYLYADKLKYRPDETVSVWGYVPADAVAAELGEKFELVIGDSYAKIPVTLDENGTFQASYKLESFSRMTLTLSLRAGDVTVASRTIEVAQYEDQNYVYEINMEKNCVLPGENVVFEVKVSHISGIDAALKPVKAVAFGKSFFAKTDKNGVARFEISSEHYERGTTDSVGYFSVSVYNATAAEYSSESVWGCSGYVILAGEELSAVKNEDKITVTVNETVLPQPPVASSAAELLGDKTDLEITADLYEKTGERYVESYVYDPYTKKNVPRYAYRWTEKLLDSITAETKDGTWTLSLEDYELKEDTDEKSYLYYVSVDAASTDGEALYERTFDFAAPKEESVQSTVSPEESLFRTEAFNGDLGFVYRLCDYRINTGDTTALSEGDRVPLKIISRDGSRIGDGSVLRILFQNGILSAELFGGDEDMSFTFEEDMFPAVGVACVYWVDGELVAIPQRTVLLGTDGRDATVEITTDSEEYAPGDQITVQIVVTDENGDPIPNMAVNMSLMNSAASTLPEMWLSTATGSYYSFDAYVYATGGSDSFVYRPGGSGGGGGTVRSVFRDAPYFGSHVTDSDGKVTVTFTLPDNITEYTVTVHAANAERFAGQQRAQVKVTKDFFIQHIPANDVKSSDDFVVNALVNSENICKVSCDISLKETGQTVTISENSGSAFEANFGKLPEGSYTVLITARSGDEWDSVEYTVDVVDSAQRFERSDLIELREEATLESVANPVELEISTRAYKDYLAYYNFIVKNYSDRTDTRLALYEGRLLANMLKYGTSYSVYSTMNDLPFGENGLLAPLPDADEDPVLTAVAMMVSPQLRSLVIARTEDTVLAPESLTEAAELLLLSAVYGHPVLKDLQYMAQHVEDDDYIEMVLALGFAAVGDYGSAREMYAASASDPGKEGYAALRALCATFICKDDAKEQIDSLLESDPSGYYLSIAVLSYMRNRCGIPEGEQSLTVTCGDFEEKITLSALETKKLTVVTKDSKDVILTPHTEDICASYTYTQGVDGLEDAPKDVGVTLESARSQTVSESVMLLTMDLSAVDGESGRIFITLPASLVPESIPDLPYGYNVVGHSTGYLEIVKLSRADCERITDAVPYSSTVQILLIVRSGGNYELESVVFVSDDGEIHLSDSIVFDVKTLNKYGLDSIPVRPLPKKED